MRSEAGDLRAQLTTDVQSPNFAARGDVDVERLKRVRLETDQGPIKVLYKDPPKAENVETTGTDKTR